MTLTSLEIKILAFIVYTFVLLGGGYYEGWRSNHDKIVEITAIAKAQDAATKEKDAEHAKITEDLKTSISATGKRLDDALARLHNASTGKLPPGSIGSKVPDGYTAVEGGTCQSAFYDKALKAELLAEQWQEWAIRQGIPVSE